MSHIMRLSIVERWTVITILVLSSLLLLSHQSYGQVTRVIRSAEPVQIDHATRAIIVDSLAQTLMEGYIFEDVAEKMVERMRKDLVEGEYDEFTTADAFIRALDASLRDISGDKHLHVSFAGPETIKERIRESEDPKLAEEARRKQLAHENFMFREVELLEGNVGYLRLDAFIDASYSGPTAVAAMNFLANCDALIIDLRSNGGGSPSLIQLMTSYLLDEPTHLNTFYKRREDITEQFWTYSHVEGPRLSDVDVYVLTSARTFSGAEEFAYNLRNLERATLVGETTGGGAHPVELQVFPSLGVELVLPYGRAINPVTKTNWEGVGVEPHVSVPESEALVTAHLMAVKALRDRAEDEQEIAELDWTIGGLEVRLRTPDVEPALLASYSGVYGDRTLEFEDGVLYYQRENRPKLRAIPMSENLFWFEEYDFFRLEVVVDDGNPIKLVGHYRQGHKDESPRTN